MLYRQLLFLTTCLIWSLVISAQLFAEQDTDETQGGKFGRPVPAGGEFHEVNSQEINNKELNKSVGITAIIQGPAPKKIQETSAQEIVYLLGPSDVPAGAGALSPSMVAASASGVAENSALQGGIEELNNVLEEIKEDGDDEGDDLKDDDAPDAPTTP